MCEGVVRGVWTGLSSVFGVGFEFGVVTRKLSADWEERVAQSRRKKQLVEDRMDTQSGAWAMESEPVFETSGWRPSGRK